MFLAHRSIVVIQPGKPGRFWNGMKSEELSRPISPIIGRKLAGNNRQRFPASKSEMNSLALSRAVESAGSFRSLDWKNSLMAFSTWA